MIPSNPGPYRPLSVRAQLHSLLCHLAINDHKTIGPIGDLSTRHLQSRIMEITPPGWRFATKGLPGRQVDVWRLE